MVAGGYIVDQAAVASCYFVLLIAYTLQLLVAREAQFQEELRKRLSTSFNYKETSVSRYKVRVLRVGKLQVIFHRVGFLVCLIQLIRYIDPYGVWGIYPMRALWFFANNVSALLMAGGSFAIYLPIDLVFVVSFHKHAPKFFMYVIYALVSVTFIFANWTCYAIIRVNIAILLFWFIFMQVSLVLLMDVYMARLLSAINRLKRIGMGGAEPVSPGSPRSPSQSMSGVQLSTTSSTGSTASMAKKITRADPHAELNRPMRHMTYFTVITNIILIIAIVAESTIAFPYAIEDPQNEVEMSVQFPPDKYRFPMPTLYYVVIQYLTLLIFYWYSYLSPRQYLQRIGLLREPSSPSLHSMAAASLSPTPKDNSLRRVSGSDRSHDRSHDHDGIRTSPVRPGLIVESAEEHEPFSLGPAHTTTTAAAAAAAGLNPPTPIGSNSGATHHILPVAATAYQSMNSP